MPFVNIKITDEGVTVDQKKRLISGASQLLQDVLNKLESSDKPPPGRKLPRATGSSHIWVGRLPSDLPTGPHVIEVRTTDVFGQTYTDRRVIRVR